MSFYNLFQYVLLMVVNIALPTPVAEAPSIAPTNEGHTVPLSDGKKFDVYLIDIATTDIRFYHKKQDGSNISNIKALKDVLRQKNQQLVFATNGGMFNADLTPTGLYVENEQEIYPLNMKQGGPVFTNFYSLQPNGVFYIKKDNTFGIVPKERYGKIENVKYATQSGPMLIIDGKVNDIFAKASKSKFIRSGVGITKRGRLMFAISHEPVSFYDFHRIFLYYACKNALYLDGAVSEMYLPELNRTETQNDFASIIAISEKIKK